MANNEESLPHRGVGSRKTHILEDEVVMEFDDGDVRHDIGPNSDPKSLVSFMQDIVDGYESDVASREELPMFAEVTDDGYVYIRDNEGGEYVMWSVNEWVFPRQDMDVDFQDWNRSDTPALEDKRTGVNENVIGAVLNAIRLAYEDPSEIRSRFDRYQIESVAAEGE